MDQVDARRRIKTAIAQRREDFILSDLIRTPSGYAMKFRQSIVDILRTGISEDVVADDAKLGALLNEVRRDLQGLIGEWRTTHLRRGWSSVFSASPAACCVAPARVEHHAQDAVGSRTQLYAPALAVVSSSPPLPLSARVDAAGVSLDGVGLLTPGRDVLAAG